MFDIFGKQRKLLREQLRLALSELKKMEQRAHDLEEQNQEKLKHLSSVQDLLESSISSEEICRSSISKLDNQVSELMQSKTDLNQKWEQRYSQLEVYSESNLANLSSTQEAVRTADEYRLALEAKIQAIEADKELLEAQTQELQEELKTRSIDSQRQIDDLAKENQAFVLQTQELQEELKTRSIDSQRQIDDLAKENQAFVLQTQELQEELKTRSIDSQRQIDDLAKENQAFVLQTQELQEELKTLSTSNQHNLSAHLLEARRLERYMKSFPEFIDYGQITITVNEDKGNEIHTNWDISDCHQFGDDFRKFSFTTVIKNGIPGLTVELIGKNGKQPYSIYPKNLTLVASELAAYQKLSGANKKRINIAVNTIENALHQKWRGIDCAAGFDPNFWQSPLSSLLKDFARLPKSLIYDRVTLINELRHMDYEHLLIELQGVQLGAYYTPQLKMRLGASLIKFGGFSRHPKFEFPLLDDQRKPFASWYEESFDDFGPKFELRYSLDDGAMDSAALARLSPSDQVLILKLIETAPALLTDLMSQNVSLSRPWITWMGLFNEVNALTAKFIKKKVA